MQPVVAGGSGVTRWFYFRKTAAGEKNSPAAASSLILSYDSWESFWLVLAVDSSSSFIPSDTTCNVVGAGSPELSVNFCWHLV